MGKQLILEDFSSEKKQNKKEFNYEIFIKKIGEL
jgi:hypothetical protein